jgi:hypothetical protein
LPIDSLNAWNARHRPGGAPDRLAPCRRAD